MKAYQLITEAVRLGLPIKRDDDGSKMISGFGDAEVRIDRRGIASHDGYTISIAYAAKILGVQK